MADDKQQPNESSDAEKSNNEQETKSVQADDDFLKLFEDIALDDNASFDPTSSQFGIQLIDLPKNIPQSVYDFIKNRHPILCLTNPQGQKQAKAKISFAPMTNWIILDFGNLLLTGPGDHAYDRDFLTKPAKETAQTLVHLAQEKKWPEVKIATLYTPEQLPLAEKMRFFAWEEANKLKLNVSGFTPSEAEQAHLEQLHKVFGAHTPSNDNQMPT